MADYDDGHGFGPGAHTGYTSHPQSARIPKRRSHPDPPDAAPGICRICRSEGTPDEPLFYPCRCSGSIQHVHQDCLMEWLSHSQKKYCELCKTPFRFTKFYNPNMPHTLPVTVFARQVGRYVLENSLGWLRAAVAILFWLVGLPWFMRCGWAAMLWLSQESWSGSTVTPTIDSDSSSTIHLSSTLIGFDMCPASPLFAPTMTPAAEVDNMLGWWANQTVTQLLVHCFFWMFGIPSPAIVSALSGRPVTSYLAPPTPPRKTLLNNVSFLKTLTRSPILNTEIIYTLEGQIITIVVIVSFVLIILVRDYVVQQQPEINMREPFEEAEEVLPTPVAVEPARPILEEDDDFGIDDDSEEDLPAEEQPTEPPSRRESFAFGRVHGPMGAHTVHEYRDDDGQRAAAELARATTQPAHSAHFPQGWTEDTSFHRRQSDGGSTNATFTPDHSQSEGTDLDQAGSSSGEAKGKERARDVPDRPQPVPLVDGGAGPSRPRAVSDGPQMHSTINPLANNTWSFTAAHDILQSDTPQCETPLPEAAASPFAEAAHQEALDSIIPTATHANLADLGDREERSSSAGRAGPSSNPVPAPAVAPRSAHDEPFEGVEATDHAQPAEAAAPRPPLPERLTDFMWGDIPDADFNPFIDAAGYEGPEDDQWQDVPMDEREDQDIDDLDDDFDVDDGVAGMDPGLDPEVVDDMDDFEGIMELLGMRGPITNLFQNVIFCAVLVQAALFIGIFIPFNLGRISLWFVAKPARLILMVYEMAKVTQDLMFALTGFLGWVVFNLMDMATGPVGGPVATHVLAARKTSWGFFAGAVNRIVSFFDGLSQDLSVPGSGMQMWSAASHEALLSIQHKIISALTSIGALFSLSGLGRFLTTAPQTLGQFLQTTLTAVSKPGGWAANLTPSQTPPVNLDNSYWPAGDLTWAILVGYATMLLISAVYLKTGFRFARGTSLEDWEIGLVDTLHQASGVLKVITIIGIEMLVFPLYCGLLLDCALLPLFAGASVSSRLQFTYNSPWTSVFVHWFVGTGYMFHFALFVSMCRKIMRPGVLYFIRDPDDPEFHPVRDVLERNLTTQLRKIMFSAFVYGALVIVCLGGVVWGLAYSIPSILPIHYSSNEPVLEFPVDLLFYNFFMPLAFRVFKPGDALHAMYSWCFRKSARILRLTYFLFGERRIDEEGALKLRDDSPYQDYPAYRLAFLGLDEDKRNVIPKPVADIVDGVEADLDNEFAYLNKQLRRRKARLVESGQLIKDGRFVRAPASDRIKIPKGRKVFLEVNESGRRLDGKPDEGFYASDQFKMVYVPPNLVPRALLFILCIWTFAAVTGVGLTVVPLVLGRAMFKAALPDHVRTNDMYAFCIGVHVLGLAAYAVLHARQLWEEAHNWLLGVQPESERLQGLARSIYQGAKISYAYTWIIFVCPLVLSVLVELYVNMPLHTLMNPPSARNFTGQTGHGHHKIRIIEAWTLGLLYQRLAVKLINRFYPDSRLNSAMRAVVRRGWLDPDIVLLTRAFVLPGVVASLTAALGPTILVNLLEAQFPSLLLGSDALGPREMAARVIRHRQAYPVVAVLAMLTRYFVVMQGGFDALKAQVRDDAYLMGERLQNYDGSPPDGRPKMHRSVVGRAAAAL